jgi:multisubunit Na+/H+ antiporter MnhC subunit
MFWIREIAGWAMIALGLYLFYLAMYVFLPNGKYLESMPSVIIGLLVFRGGIHLLKVAVAARVCRRAPVAEQPKVAVPKPTLTKGRGVVPGKR